jgi:seryl-tRNA synthetase
MVYCYQDNNIVQRSWAPEGITVEKRNVLSHHEVLLRLDGYDPDRGVKVVGHRGYFLRNWGVFLNQALINYGLEFLSERGYTALQTPQFMLKDYMAKTAQLEQFDEELYKVVDGEEEKDKYLIATSEQPISAFHADEWLVGKDLPIRWVTAIYSPCLPTTSPVASVLTQVTLKVRWIQHMLSARGRCPWPRCLGNLPRPPI